MSNSSEEDEYDIFISVEDKEGSADGPSTPKRKRRGRGELSKSEKVSENRPKRYQVKWEELPEFRGWLTAVKDDPMKARCTACNTTFRSGKSELEKHASGQKHRKRVKEIRGVPNIASQFATVANTASSKHKDAVKKAEIILSAFFAEHNVALCAVEHLLPALKRALPDSKILQDVKLGRTKCTEIITNVVAKVETETVVQRLKDAPCFSVMIDGSTDHSLHKTMCVLVRDVATDPVPQKAVARILLCLSLWSWTHVTSAEKQFQSLKHCLEGKGIQMNKIIGFGCDNESTMTGERNSVWSRIRDGSPDCVLMGCSCHSSATSASVACSKLPSHLDDLMSKVSSYLAGSAKRQANLRDFQGFFQAEKHKILKLSKTRWLCRQVCVQRILEQWDVLAEFFQVESFDEQRLTENRKRPATEILRDLKNPYTKAYFHFLDYSLNFFNKFNALLQSDKILIHRLRDHAICLVKELCQNYMEGQFVDHIITSRVDDPRTFQETPYLGASCEKYLEDIPSEYKVGVPQLRKRCMEFYVAAAMDIKSRLPSLNDSLFEKVKFVDPRVALSSSARSDLRDLRILTSRFKEMLHLDEDALALEWRTMPHCIPESEKELIQKLEPDQAWGELGAMATHEGKLRFSELTKLARGIISLPHANADCERIFSIVTDVRKDKRNLIGSASLNAICVVRSCFRARGVDCTSFEVTKRHLELHNQEMYNFRHKST